MTGDEARDPKATPGGSSGSTGSSGPGGSGEAAAGAPTSGWFEGAEHVLPIRVYYEDTDFTGIVYHGTYFRFMERARTEMLRTRGVTHQDLGAGVYGPRLHFVISEIACRFRAPARVDDVVLVRSRCETVGPVRMVIEQTVSRAATPLATGRVELALVDGRGRPNPVPPGVLERLVG